MSGVVQRLTRDASNAWHDVYSSCFLGDDAGKSVTVSLVLQPTQVKIKGNNTIKPRIDLGMTFLEINGRAYVKTVAPQSAAAAAGVVPQDAVQYACVFHKDWMPSSEGGSDKNDLVDASTNPDDTATRFALDMEQKGVRISYDELRHLLAEAMDPTQSAFLSPPTSKHNNSSSWNGPPIPSTVNVCVPMESTPEDDPGYLGMNRPSSPFRGEMPRPVVFVFRRTRQRKSVPSAAVPSFRLDDECDVACALVKRLAPTADMEIPPPDTWEELVHDGTDWLLGRGSMLPPKHANNKNQANGDNGSSHAAIASSALGHLPAPEISTDEEGTIPLDDFERERALKLAHLRSRMAAEAMKNDWTDDVEAATIRGMIQKAVGLAFVRASKIVLGVSLHGGSGIVVARLSDGTWSAPSAIGTWGLGLGIQFGLEVAEYIFILQTQEALDHFRRGGSFTIGGNMGAAVAGLGREAYGAASVGGICGSTSTVKDDEYNDSNSREEHKAQSVAIAPIVAYAKSQGLYVGVSLEGSRLFARDDINSRTYKFTSGMDVSADDILTGKVPAPPEAEELYAALHSVEFTHEMACLPRPPEVLRKDSVNIWQYDRSTLAEQLSHPASSNSSVGSSRDKDPFTFLQNLSKEEADKCEAFETQFKKFMYGGVSVQRLLPDTEGRAGRTGKERRTLWLMLPEIGSLRLGFVSKLSDGEGTISNKSSTQRARQDDPSRISGFDGDVGTVGSEELTLDSALNTRDGSTIGHIRNGNVQLSSKHSVALTDVTVLSQEPLVPVRFKGEDKMEHLRVISIQDVSGTSLLFLANNFREAELLVCGLKFLLERETSRLGVRGGLPITTFGGKTVEGAMSPSAARGFRDMPTTTGSIAPPKRKTSKAARSSGYVSSDAADDSVSDVNKELGRELPDSRRTWANVPGRDYMRGQAAAFTETNENGAAETGVPQYVHGQQLVRDIARNVRLPLPLPLCRVLLLDSTSPVIKKWESDRGDTNFDKSRWTFPPATPRELERHTSEHQLIASGSMCEAHRTTSFDRPRYGSMVRLSESHTVDADDSKRLAFTVTEQNPRRGFAIKVHILLRAHKENVCDATAVAEIRPVGKDMSNQAAVHKAFLLVMDEIKERYGVEGHGLMAGFLSVVDNMGDPEGPAINNQQAMANASARRPFHRTGPVSEEKKIDHPSTTAVRKDKLPESGLVSFEDMLKTGRQSPEPEAALSPRAPTPSVLHQIPDAAGGSLFRPATESNNDGGFMAVASDGMVRPVSPDEKDPVLIEVKPLPKIRLSLMPSPREEDEEHSSASSLVPSKPVKKKKASSSSKKKRNGASSWRKPSRQTNKKV